MDDRLLNMMFAVVDELNRQLPAGHHVAKEIDAALVGDNGCLDSLGLVNFVVAVEQNVEREYGKAVSLTDPDVMERWSDIFQTLGTLCEYLDGEL